MSEKSPEERQEKLIGAIRDLIATLNVTNQLLRADQDRRHEEQEKAAELAAQQTEALERLLDEDVRLREQDGDEPHPY